ncbi:DUF448 domain-containing protein [Mycoplasma sp. 2045]|uniref:YlxR family protein n=1 Tax=unclassified Mycoplasma TaxID=2683645 RepID=UPI00211C514E|nr:MULTISPECIES: YlxR family protein [unclassified Mycoplasma]MEA4134475.1 YlxR family protein [Mycoplasma sp. 2704]MEA4162704.1 YlxR family protein [Mycoplasma sp. 4404]MEA4191018.1 YlxR family protein [Mycoplasma sp. 2248]MEA4333840.1 YlxR family protein [Mycoplasma sp. 1232]UUM20566.1 DUF448 domain-containing protein [Mycoplasma sp. 2045]
MTEIKTVFRKCIATNQVLPVDELTRFSYDKENNLLVLDLHKNKKHRGAYFVASLENWQKIRKTKALNRTYKTNISDEQYDSLENELKEVLYG